MLNPGVGGAGGQFVVVESTTNKKLGKEKRDTFRGKLDVLSGESVEIHNTTGDQIRLFFPETKIFEESTPTEVKVENGRKFTRKFASLEEEGRYEYAVLYKRALLAKPHANHQDGAEWGIAIGGSSSEFIIRRPLGL